jgi:N-acetylglucosaminyl-diphospho-decaprenol L-rhamnosyltransferase
MLSLYSNPSLPQNDRMRICAIVLNYLGFSDTVECVGSLLEDDALSQIVIVENSVSDEERSKIQHTFCGREEICILCPEKNLGFAGGVNFALTSVDISAFDAFLILNNDTLIPAGTIRLLEGGLHNADFDFVAPVIYEYPETGLIWSKGNHYNRFTGLIFHYPLAFVPGSLYYLTGCCLLIRSEVFKTIGLFDEIFFMYGEDVEFCFRAVEHGLKFGLVPEARIFHKGTGSSGNNSLFYEYHINRSHLLLCNKLARTPKEVWISWPLKLVAMSMRAIWRVLRYGNLHALEGLRLSMLEFLR